MLSNLVIMRTIGGHSFILPLESEIESFLESVADRESPGRVTHFS
jgi:hypothetical protein